MNHYLKKTSEKFQAIKHNLTHIGSKESLGLFAFVIVLFLDLFILLALFEGLSDHTKQLTTPGESVPELCHEIILENDWTAQNKLGKLSDVITSSYRRDLDRGYTKAEKLHPVCNTIFEKLISLRKQKDILLLFKTRDKMSEEYDEIKNALDKTKTTYDTILLQKIAKDSSLKTADVDKIKNEFEQKAKRYNILTSELKLIDSRINAKDSIKDFWQEWTKLKKTSQKKLSDDLKRQNFWYPIKKILMQMAFLLPLLFLFYLWNSISIRKDYGLQTLISSHLIIIIFIPILLNISETIYDIIPKKLLKYIWELLISLKLIAIWHYIIIFSAIAIALTVIYIVQKKIFSFERLMEKRIARGNCLDCGKKIPDHCNACPFCGFVQMKKCKKCKSLTYIHAKHCKNCGTDLAE